MKESLQSLAIRETQIKTAISHELALTRMASIQKSEIINSDEAENKRELKYIFGKNSNLYND